MLGHPLGKKEKRKNLLFGYRLASFFNESCILFHPMGEKEKRGGKRKKGKKEKRKKGKKEKRKKGKKEKSTDKMKHIMSEHQILKKKALAKEKSC